MILQSRQQQPSFSILYQSQISVLHLLSAHVFYHWLEHQSHSGTLQEMQTLSNEDATLWSVMKQICNSCFTHLHITYSYCQVPVGMSRVITQNLVCCYIKKVAKHWLTVLTRDIIKTGIKQKLKKYTFYYHFPSTYDIISFL